MFPCDFTIELSWKQKLFWASKDQWNVCRMQLWWMQHICHERRSQFCELDFQILELVASQYLTPFNDVVFDLFSTIIASGQVFVVCLHRRSKISKTQFICCYYKNLHFSLNICCRNNLRPRLNIDCHNPPPSPLIHHLTCKKSISDALQAFGQ